MRREKPCIGSDVAQVSRWVVNTAVPVTCQSVESSRSSSLPRSTDEIGPLLKMSASCRNILLVATALLACLIYPSLAQAPAPAPGIAMVNAAEAAALYPISNEEVQPLRQSATLPVTCNMTMIGLPASRTPATASAGRRLLAATNTSRGLQTADVHCTGSYNVTIVGGPALQTFSQRWTGGCLDPTAQRMLCRLL